MRNNLITHGGTEKFNKLEPFKEKWESFGWSVIVVDGHSFENLIQAFKTFFGVRTVYEIAYLLPPSM